MIKIACIGAGNRFFSPKMVTDILDNIPFGVSGPIEVWLMDWQEKRVKLTFDSMNDIISGAKNEYRSVSLHYTMNLRKAIENAKYVISTLNVGDIEAVKMDFDIPLKFGISQTNGDTLGPGGIFRFLRQVPVYREIIRLMNEVGYNAGLHGKRSLHAIYSNPIALGTWYCNALWENSTVGICHGVQSTAELIRSSIDVSPQDFSYMSAGINHLNWFLNIYYREPQSGNWMDAYPLLRTKMESDPSIIGSEKIRWDMFKATGFFMTESSGSLSDILPYYRKKKAFLNSYKGAEDGYNSLNQGEDLKNYERFEQNILQNVGESNVVLDLFHRAHEREFISGLILAIETDRPFKFYGNVVNQKGGLITNLPENCCVEVPCMADSFGIHPQGGINLPTICQGLCSSNILAQQAVIEGALNLNPEKIYHALLLDPLTSSILTPEKIRELFEEMGKKQHKWLDWID